MKSARQTLPDPRSLQEWMERTGTTAERLIALVLKKTGTSISRAMMSYILTGSRRCSFTNALALYEVTRVPFDTLRAWPKPSVQTKVSGKRSTRAA